MITAKTMEERALAASLINWTVLFLFVNGMWLAASDIYIWHCHDSDQA
jgi:hypothetical protein